jgi:amino acid transporter
MFTFISYWRTAAVVLCDLASTVYYIGGVVESSIGPAAPWFILGVMVFSYFVRMVYIESCSLFVRGGVYRVVKEAMGGFLAKLSVSALMFDYVLTGPTSGVSAGQYVMGTILLFIKLAFPAAYAFLHLDQTDPGQTGEVVQRWGSVALAVLVTLYFFRQNVRGIHESSDKAMKIMWFTTAMAVILIVWCLASLVINGPAQWVPWQPDVNAKVEHVELKPSEGETLDLFRQRLVDEYHIDADRVRRFTERELQAGVNVQDLQRLDRLLPKTEDGQPVPKNNDSVQEVNDTFGTSFFRQDDPWGFLANVPWLRAVGVLGLFLAFGHSILAMSGEETLAQVYREVEAPKLRNFKRAAFIVFVYSMMLTAGVSFLAVMIIPDEVRMKFYSGNLIGGLARHVIGPDWLKLILETFVVGVGFLILAGAVNTAIIGSNGVLNRIAEDGVLPDWFLKPHPKYGTTYRLLILITSLQVFVIVVSMGHVIILGEAYAFGVVWSFVFKALSMVVLRFTHREKREYMVPLNIKVGNVYVPIGLSLIFLVLLTTAILNFFTKEVATIGGTIFTIAFVLTFIVSERLHERKRRAAGTAHQPHMEQFNRATTEEVTPDTIGLAKPYRKLVSIRSTLNLFMLEKALAETDPATTAVVVMTAKVAPVGEAAPTEHGELDTYDQKLMTAVVDKAEHAGKQVKPMIVPTNNPLHAVLKTAMDLKVQELILGASNKYTVDEQLEQIAFYWINLHGGQPAPLTVRILSRERDVYLDIGGGSRIPKISERQARSVAELRAAGVGVDRVLMLHDGSMAHSDLFQAVLTMLDPEVALGVLPICADGAAPAELLVGQGLQPPPQPGTNGVIHQDEERARKLGRGLTVLDMPAADGPAIVERLRQDQYDLVILPLPEETQVSRHIAVDERCHYILRHAHCRVFLAAAPGIPQEVVDKTPSAG